MIYKPNPISEFLLQIYNKILEFASVILNISAKNLPTIVERFCPKYKKSLIPVINFAVD